MSLYEHMAVVAILYALQWASVYTLFPRVWGITYGAVPFHHILGYATLGIPLLGTLGYYVPYIIYPLMVMGMTLAPYQIYKIQKELDKI